MDPGETYKLVANGVYDLTDPACGCNLIMPNSTVLFTNSCPVVTAQPDWRTEAPGCQATFRTTIVGMGGTPLVEGSYQWFKNNIAILGATNSFYETPPVVLADQGAMFHVVASNDCGTVTSSNASLFASS